MVSRAFCACVEVVSEANINVICDWRMPVLGEVNEMKSGEAPGLDGFQGQCFKKGGTTVLEWIVKLLNVSFDMRVVSTG